jgi:hypothetical protein
MSGFFLVHPKIYFTMSSNIVLLPPCLLQSSTRWASAMNVKLSSPCGSFLQDGLESSDGTFTFLLSYNIEASLNIDGSADSDMNESASKFISSSSHSGWLSSSPKSSSSELSASSSLCNGGGISSSSSTPSKTLKSAGVSSSVGTSAGGCCCEIRPGSRSCAL